jgi:hypothetical protein
MASKEELSDQLSLTTKLAAQVERMAAAAEKLEASYQSQIDAATKLAAALNSVDGASAGQSLGAMSKALKDIEQKMKDTGKVSESTFKNLGKKVEDAGASFGKKFPKSVGIAAGALSGFGQGIKNVLALGKGVAGFAASFVDGLANITASIIAIPFKIFEGLVDMAAKAATGSTELMQALEDLRKQFGAFYGPTNKAIIDTSKSLTGFKDTGLSAWRVFGNMADRLKMLNELATEMGGSFGMLRKEFEDNGGALLAYKKGLGILDEDMKGVTMRSVAMGTKTSASLKDMTKQSYALGTAFGLDAKLISRDMSKALTDVAHFGGATVKQIGEASTYARKLGFELKDITGTLDAFDTFDTAAENAAKLSQAFGVNIDAFELMKAQNPAEQLELLRKSFKSAGVDASNFDRASLKLAATTTGLSEDVVQSALSLKNQGVSLDDIKKKSADAEKSTLTQAQAMAKLADAIERMVQQGQGLEGGFWKMFLKGIKNGIMSSQDFYGMIRNIQRALMDVYMIGVKLGRVLAKIVPGFSDIFGGLKEFFAPKYFDKMFNSISTSVKRFFDKDSPDKGSIPNLVKGLHNAVVDWLTDEGPHGKRILEGFKTFFKSFAKIAADGITWLSHHLADGMKTVLDLLTGKKKLDTGGAAGAAQGGLGFLADALHPLFDALKGAWKELKGPVHDLVMQVGHMLKNFLTSKEFLNAIKPALPVLAAALFGPAFGRGIIGGLSTSIVKSVLGGGAKEVIKKVAVAAAKSSSTEGILGGVSKFAGGAALVGAAAAIGDGVDKYTKDVTSTLDHSSAVIAAGATGLIDALTLGLLPKGFDKTIANVLATVSDDIFSAISTVFGSGFGSSLKKQLASTFEVFGSLWSLLKNLFTGNQSDINQSMKDLGLGILRFVVGAVDMTFVQLPIMLAKIATQILGVVQTVILSLVSALASGITGVVDDVFGTHLTAKVEAATDAIKAAMTKSTDDTVKSLTDVGKAVSDASDEIQDKYLRSAQDQANEAARKASAVAKTTADMTTDAAKTAVDESGSTISKVSDTIAAVKDVQKQLDDKSFDVVGSVNAIKEKLKDVDFDFITGDRVASIVQAAANSKIVTDSVEAIKGTFDKLTELAHSVKGNEANKSGLAGALGAISEMVKQANNLNDALSDGGINKIDIRAKLENVANAVGLGGKASYTVNPSKEVQITVNMTVTMDAGTVEKVILQREGSILRDRINFATNNPTQRATTEIPNNPSSPILPANGHGTAT